MLLINLICTLTKDTQILKPVKQPVEPSLQNSS